MSNLSVVKKFSYKTSIKSAITPEYFMGTHSGRRMLTWSFFRYDSFDIHPPHDVNRSGQLSCHGLDIQSIPCQMQVIPDTDCLCSRLCWCHTWCQCFAAPIYPVVLLNSHFCTDQRKKKKFKNQSSQ